MQTLLRHGFAVSCLGRPRAGPGGRLAQADIQRLLPGAALRFGDVTDAAWLVREGFAGKRFNALVSCLASRTGASADAGAVDHPAHSTELAAAKQSGIGGTVLLSAICVQKPLPAF